MTVSVFSVEKRDHELGQRIDDVKVKMELGSSRGKQLRWVFDARDHDGSPLAVRGIVPRFLDERSTHRTKAG